MTHLEFRIYRFLEINFAEGASESDISSHIKDVNKEEVKTTLEAMVNAGKIGIETQDDTLYYL